MANLLWLQGGACSGNTMSFLNAEEPSACDLVTDFGLKLLWHPSLGMELGENARAILQDVVSKKTPLDILVFEGTVVNAPQGAGTWNRFAGRPMKEWVRELASVARYVLAVGSDLNGPVIGAILTIVGFAAFGKHPRNVVPIMLGVFLAGILKPWSPADPSIVLAALFGTTLAPIAGRFGWHWGIVAGVLHASAATSVGWLHAGLNLYNNGFAAGLVAAVLVPVIVAVTGRKESDAATSSETKR